MTFSVIDYLKLGSEAYAVTWGKNHTFQYPIGREITWAHG